MGKGTKTLVAFLVLIIILVIAYLFYTPETKTSTLFISLTDPAHLPKGTSSLFISYGLVQAHTSNSSGSAWAGSQESGTINLLSLANASRVVAKLAMPPNSTITAVRMNITSANITINGTTYPIVMLSRQLSANASGSLGGYANLMLSLSPTVVVLYNGSEGLFVMLPSLSSALLSATSGLYVGDEAGINSSSSASLAASTPNISIASAALAAQGNQTSISLTVADRSKQPVTIRNVILLGNESAAATIGSLNVNVPPAFGSISASSLLNGTFSIISNALSQLGRGASSINANAFPNINISSHTSPGSNSCTSPSQISGIVAGGLLNGSIPSISSINDLNLSSRTTILKGVLANLSGSAAGLQNENASVLEARIKARISSGNLSGANLANIINLIVKAQADAQAEYAQNVRLEQMSLDSLDFFVTSNSELALPSSTGNLSSSAYGYTVQPGAAATLTFNGKLSLAGGRVAVSLINGDSYKIEVIGGAGAFASLNVTAS